VKTFFKFDLIYSFTFALKVNKLKSSFKKSFNASHFLLFDFKQASPGKTVLNLVRVKTVRGPSKNRKQLTAIYLANTKKKAMPLRPVTIKYSRY